MRFENKVFLITGSGGDIGTYTAGRLAKEGAKLALVDIRQEALDRAAERCGLPPDRCITIQADVTKEEQVKAYVEKTVVAFGRIDVFFSLAGMQGDFCPLTEINMDRFDALTRLNVYAPLMGLKYVLPVMYEQESGSVINVASQSVLRGGDGAGAYPITKSAVIQMTKIAAIEAGRHNVRVNVICPALVDGGSMMQHVIHTVGGDDEAGFRRRVKMMIPLGRWPTMEDIVNTVMYLASDESSFINGLVLPIDGGQTCK